MTDIVERLEYIGSICEAEGIARTAYDGATEITHLRQLLSEAEKREREARNTALEEAAKVADEAAAMRERLFQENGASLNASKAAQALLIAANIRALQLEER